MQNLYEQFTGIVVQHKDQDPGSAGAVRVKLLGYTDDLDDADQPWAYPVNATIEKTPKPGTYVDVRCTNGDRAFLRYHQGTGLDAWHSEEFRDGFPNMTVVDNGIYVLYDEKSHVTRERDMNTGYERRISQDGVTDITAPVGYSISGREQVPSSPVITAAAVNICTGKPIGQGSEFYSIPDYRIRTKRGIQ